MPPSAAPGKRFSFNACVPATEDEVGFGKELTTPHEHISSRISVFTHISESLSTVIKNLHNVSNVCRLAKRPLSCRASHREGNSTHGMGLIQSQLTARREHRSSWNRPQPNYLLTEIPDAFCRFEILDTFAGVCRTAEALQSQIGHAIAHEKRNTWAV